MVQIAKTITLNRRLDTTLCRIKEGLYINRQNTMLATQLIVVTKSVVIPYMYAIINEILYVGISLETTAIHE